MSGNLMDIYYQQVADNLARFVADPDAVPSMAKASGGTVQSSEQATPSFSIMWPSNSAGVPNVGSTVNYQRTLNWALVPVTSPTDLARLRAVMREAIDAPLDPSGTKPREFAAEWQSAVDLAPLPAGPSVVIMPGGPAPAPAPAPVPAQPPKPTKVPIADHKPTITKGFFEKTKPRSGTPVYYTGNFGDTTVYITNQRAMDDFVLVVLGAAPQATDTAQKSIMFQTTGALLNPR